MDTLHNPLEGVITGKISESHKLGFFYSSRVKIPKFMLQLCVRLKRKCIKKRCAGKHLNLTTFNSLI